MFLVVWLNFFACWQIYSIDLETLNKGNENFSSLLPESSLVAWPTDSINDQALLNFSTTHSVRDGKAKKTWLALKTNLLYDLATIINIELEVPIRDKWSVNIEYMFPWWVDKKNNDFALQLLSGNLEGRYWLTNRLKHPQILTGHYVGLFAGGGIYDFQLKKEGGYQGDFRMAGVAFGYTIPVFHNNFTLEFSLGVGYVFSNYSHYKYNQDKKNLQWNYDANYNWIGPNKAKVSLAWLIGRNQRK